MEWMINKNMKPRKKFSLNIFPIPTLQLGDIVSIQYDSPDGKELVDSSSRFMIEQISYSRGLENISQILEVVEV